ncbi:MAG: GrpB family protein [Coriobacteriia bacterium]|nr:GrpB family protein [Coriobacteriia bacterium]
MESFEDKLSRVLAEPIEVVDYDPAWPALFDAESARLTAYFPPGSIRRIEHVGSTAVPGLAAKPIVDILVGVDEFGFVVDSVAPAMERAGYDYFFRPELGDDGPRYPWFIGRDASGARVSHIHVALVDDAPQWDRVVFRDYLRGHRDLALEYARLKRELAARLSDDREAYTLAKTAFITEALALARAEGLTSASTQTARPVR